MMHAYYLCQWILFFFIYSFAGWVWECCYVSVRKRRWVNRGFMHGPILPLYGSGALVILIGTIPVRENIALVFICGMIGATILEYITGAAMAGSREIFEDISVRRHLCAGGFSLC